MSRGHRSILICSPTGSGKTALTAHMLKAAASKSLSSWFLVHRRELLYQSSRAFDSIDLDHGIVCSGIPFAPNKTVQICSVQSLARRASKLTPPKLIIYDECHHIGAASWERIFKSNPQAYHIGLTASPVRADGKGLSDYFSQMINGPSVSDLIKQGFLSDYKAYAPSTVDTSGLHTSMGDYIRSELTDLMNKPKITGNAIDEYINRAVGKRNIVFCASIEHSTKVAEEFNNLGIKARHVDGKTPHTEREESLRLFQSGEIKVLCNVDLFGEGLDVPAVECVTLLRPTQSLGLHIQQIGRAMRPFPGKTHAVIIDHVGNIQRHGLPDEDREWDLNGVATRKESKDSISVKTCLVCFAAQRPGPAACIYCGGEFKVTPRTVKEIEGELKEIDKQAIITARKSKRQEQGRAQTFDELVAIGRARGYKNAYAWAKYTFNGRQRRKLYGA